jgi:hypothetical protein
VIGITTVMLETGMIEPAMVEICGVVSIEERPIVFVIDPVAIVTAPGRIVIIGVSGEIGFDNGGSGIVATCIYRSGGVDNGSGYGGSYIDPGSWNTETDMRAYEYLGIAFGSDKAGGYNGGEDK